MEVMVDNVWATPSTLHMRVTVWGPDKKWRNKYNASVPIDTIPDEAIAPWLLALGPGRLSPDREQLPLF